jgi:hypothetical protein
MMLCAHTIRRLQLSPEEQKALTTAHANSEATRANGIRLAGQKYFTLQANERSIYGKKQVCVLQHCMIMSHSSNH